MLQGKLIEYEITVSQRLIIGEFHQAEFILCNLFSLNQQVETFQQGRYAQCTRSQTVPRTWPVVVKRLAL